MQRKNLVDDTNEGWALCLAYALIFTKNQAQYAYKCYAYKKNMY